MNPETLEVLLAAWDGGFFTRSNVARRLAEKVACAACLGLITTQSIDKSYGKCWRITPRGCALLFEEKALDKSQAASAQQAAP